MNQKIKYYLPIISSFMIQSCSINTSHSKEVKSVVINRMNGVRPHEWGQALDRSIFIFC
jgi:hypothetical protein